MNGTMTTGTGAPCVPANNHPTGTAAPVVGAERRVCELVSLHLAKGVGESGAGGSGESGGVEIWRW